MTRAEKIKDLQAKIETIKVVWQPLNDQLEKYKIALYHAEKSFEIGEKAEYKDPNCSRRCCGYTTYNCVVMSINDNHTYNLQADTGEIFNYVSDLDMVRACNNKK